MLPNGFANSFTCGEIAEDAWDRSDIEPVQKGCEQAFNLLHRVAGPLGKRRGFWCNGKVGDESKAARLIPFRRSIDSALMLELGDSVMRVWTSTGVLVLAGGVPYTLATPFSAAQLDGLRWKQVGDVLYFLHRDGLAPQTLQHFGDTNWVWTTLAFKNGPWRPENIDTTLTLTVARTGGTASDSDTTTYSTAGSIGVGGLVTLTFPGGRGIFDAGMIGSYFRIREGDGTPGVQSWAPNTRQSALGAYAMSNARVYKLDVGNASLTSGLTPPVNHSGKFFDGNAYWDYLHDGAGIVQITAVASADQASGTIIATLPVKDGAVTAYWSEAAYSAYRGWPTCWPALREERLAMGGTTTGGPSLDGLDQLDITETAGFGPTYADFTPGTGTGQVISTDSIRRRLGDDGARLQWTMATSYLIAATESAEFIVAGSVLDEPLSPSTCIVKQVSSFGVTDAAPAKAWDGALFIAQGGQTLRELRVDQGQQAQGRDLTVLAGHVGVRGLAEICWIKQPDNVLWARLSDGGLAAYVYQQEQRVEGWCTQNLPGGFKVEYLASIPGAGRFETLWMVVSRVKNAALQRQVWMLAAAADLVFYDCSFLYAGAPAGVVAGLDVLEGEEVAIMADGVEYAPQKVAGGQVALPNGDTAARIVVGLSRLSRFKSLKLDLNGPGGSVGRRQRITTAIVTLKTSEAMVGAEGDELERFIPREEDDIPGAAPRLMTKLVTFADETERDPRIVVEDATGYDFVLHSILPSEEAA